MGRKRDAIRHAVGHTLDKMRKHQRAFDRVAGCALLGVVLLAGLWLWTHHTETKIVAYSADLIPVLLAVLIAFAPDLRKTHMAWRVAIIGVGIIGSALLYQKEQLQSRAETEAISKAVTQAVTEANRNADKSIKDMGASVLKAGQDNQRDTINTIREVGKHTPDVQTFAADTARKLDERIAARDQVSIQRRNEENTELQKHIRDVIGYLRQTINSRYGMIAMRELRYREEVGSTDPARRAKAVRETPEEALRRTALDNEINTRMEEADFLRMAILRRLGPASETDEDRRQAKTFRGAAIMNPATGRIYDLGALDYLEHLASRLSQ